MRAIVPGTFDPITSGHVDIICRAARMFEEVIVGVAGVSGKNPLFSLEERASLARESLAHVSNVSVEAFSGLLVDFALEKKAEVVVKGLRVVTDFEYEFQMAQMNMKLCPNLESVFIMSSPQYMYLSSSIVRELALLGANVDCFVPPCVVEALGRKVAELS